MFTGLIQDVGVVQDISKADGGDVRIKIATAFDLTAVQIGASICCSGCCLTVIEIEKNTFDVEVSAETLNKTRIGSWSVNQRVNLEPSLKIGDEMGGHIVSGHVDCVTNIETISPVEGSHKLVIAIPEGYAPYIAAKGSIAIDGISLTVNEADEKSFSVNIIPHTWDHTTLCDRANGDQVHIEIDMLARYVARNLEFRT